MSIPSKNQPVEVSRRSMLLQGFACATGVAGALTLGTELAMAGKMPPSAVSYRVTPNGSKKCSNCVLFEPSNACRSVSGVISPNGWCSIWRA